MSATAVAMLTAAATASAGAAAAAKPKAPKMPAPPPPAAISGAGTQGMEAGEIAARRAARRRGFASTLLTGELAGSTGKNTLLGGR